MTRIEMRQLISAGVTGLISDYPNRVQEVLEEQIDSKCLLNKH